MEDKRYYKRIEFHVGISIKDENNFFIGELYDISLKGALVKIPGKTVPHSMTVCRTLLTLPNSSITLEFEARIVHRNGEFYGLKFEKTDVDSITHLRRLLVLNTGSEELIEREIVYWLNDRR